MVILVCPECQSEELYADEEGDIICTNCNAIFDLTDAEYVNSQ